MYASAEIFLLDDDDKQLADAEINNVKIIKACGYPKDDTEICNDYLQIMLDQVNLSITLSVGDPAQRAMKRFKMLA